MSCNGVLLNSTIRHDSRYYRWSCGGGCYYVGGLFAFRRYYRPETRAEIINPSHQSENGGRHITVSVNIPRRRRRAVYRIAIQPNDCRADGIWRPQNAPLSVNASGSASLPRVRLGRDGPQDVGKHLPLDFSKCLEMRKLSSRALPIEIMQQCFPLNADLYIRLM